ncbi:MAG: hypothetical protein ABI614_18630, partial [Planctomycetota bacterium]
MQLSKSVTLVTVALLSVCVQSSAEERTAASSQRYMIHVPTEVKFAQVQLPTINEAAEQNAAAHAALLFFMAETTSGLTIQFESQSAT